MLGRSHVVIKTDSSSHLKRKDCNMSCLSNLDQN